MNFASGGRNLMERLFSLIQQTRLMARRKDDPQHSVAIQLDLALSDFFDGLIEELRAEVHDHHKLRETKDARAGTTKALGVVLANLFRAYQRDPKLFVGLSMSGNSYKDGNYNPYGVSYRSIRRVIEYLSQIQPPLMETKKGIYFPETNTNYNTRIRATTNLIEKLVAFVPKEPAEILHCITNDTSDDVALHSYYLFQLFERKELPTIRVKDANKHLIDDFKETAEMKGMRDRLDSYNAFLSEQWIDVFIPDNEFLALSRGERSLSDEEIEAFGDTSEVRRGGIDLLFQRRLYRVFNNGTLDHGGRFYGGWWQCIPSAYRKFVTINWYLTQELDFSNMQAAMLYAMEGENLEGDAYQLEGIDPGPYRKLIKRSFFKLINAEGQVRAPLKNELPKGWTWSQLQEALRKKHAPIAKHFNSGIGIELQRIDSEIAEDVMLKMMEQDILCLPVHDSFLVHVNRAKDLKKAMANAYKAWMKSEIGIDADPSFLDTEIPAEAFELDKLGAYPLEDTIDDLEAKKEYSNYRQRKLDFLAHKDEKWRWLFYARAP